MVCLCWPIGIAILAFVIIGISYLKFKKVNILHKHVVIVGASSGIGLAAAKHAVSLGAKVTMIARNPERLNAAVRDINSKYGDKNTHAIYFDVTSGSSGVAKVIKEAEAVFGPIYMLINCAGMAICGRLEDMKEEDVSYLTNLNYLGSLWMTRAVLPAMKARGEGSIVLVSSGAALLGIYGFSAYGATKWAIRGLGEALIMETVGTGVTVTLSFPPDTDTPGFETEEASKPQETKIISSSGGLHSPEDVAKQLITDAVNGEPYSTVGFESWMLCVLCGTSNTGFINTVIQSILIGPIRLSMMFYQYYFHYVIRKCMKERNSTKKEK